MNCRLAQEEMQDAFAAGLSVLPQEVLAHRENCPGCQTFYQEEEDLFASLDTALENIVNQPVPGSLFPRIRARLEPAPARGLFPLQGWNWAALTAAIVLVSSLGFLRSHQHPRGTVMKPVTTASFGASLPAPESQRPFSVMSRGASAMTGPKAAPVARARRAKAEPGIIVLTEEREAFARYVAGRGQEQVLVAVASAGTKTTDSDVEVALLRVDELQIAPLESRSAE